MAIRCQYWPAPARAALLGVCAISASAVLAIWPGSSADAAPEAYHVGWYAITNGVSRSNGSCYGLSGTVGQPASGYAIGGTYALVSGYMAAAPATGLDAIFHNGFEGC